MGWGLGEERGFLACPATAQVVLNLEENEISKELHVWARGKGTFRLGEKSPGQS